MAAINILRVFPQRCNPFLENMKEADHCWQLSAGIWLVWLVGDGGGGMVFEILPKCLRRGKKMRRVVFQSTPVLYQSETDTGHSAFPSISSSTLSTGSPRGVQRTFWRSLQKWSTTKKEKIPLCSKNSFEFFQFFNSSFLDTFIPYQWWPPE